MSYKKGDFIEYMTHQPEILLLEMFGEIDYLSNHSDENIAIAMEVVIQFANLYEDGIYEVSPKMYDYLESSVNYLQSVDCKDKPVESSLQNGAYFLRVFRVAEIHTNDEISDILLPPM